MKKKNKINDSYNVETLGMGFSYALANKTNKDNVRDYEAGVCIVFCLFMR